MREQKPWVTWFPIDRLCAGGRVSMGCPGTVHRADLDVAGPGLGDLDRPRDVGADGAVADFAGDFLAGPAADRDAVGLGLEHHFAEQFVGRSWLQTRYLHDLEGPSFVAEETDLQIVEEEDGRAGSAISRVVFPGIRSGVPGGAGASRQRLIAPRRRGYPGKTGTSRAIYRPSRSRSDRV